MKAVYLLVAVDLVLSFFFPEVRLCFYYCLFGIAGIVSTRATESLVIEINPHNLYI